MIPPDGSISGNLACTIPEVTTTLRAKMKLQETLNMETERMISIDEEITASNTRKFRTSSIVRAHFSKQYTNNGTQRREQINSMLEYQQRVDAVTTETMRRFYTFCDVQAGRRSTMNTSKHSGDE